MVSAPGAFVLTFGKHAGRRLADVPPHYIVWLADTAKSPAVRIAAKAFLGIDGHGPDADPDTFAVSAADPGSAAVLFPRVCWMWEMHMLAEFGDDPDDPTGEAVKRGVEVLRSLCVQVTGREFANESPAGEHELDQ